MTRSDHQDPPVEACYYTYPSTSTPPMDSVADSGVYHDRRYADADGNEFNAQHTSSQWRSPHTTEGN